MAFQPNAYQNDAFQIVTFEDSLTFTASASLPGSGAIAGVESVQFGTTAEMVTGQIIPPTLIADLQITSGTLTAVLQLYGDQQDIVLSFPYKTMINGAFQANAFQDDAFQIEFAGDLNSNLLIT